MNELIKENEILINILKNELRDINCNDDNDNSMIDIVKVLGINDDELDMILSKHIENTSSILVYEKVEKDIKDIMLNRIEHYLKVNIILIPILILIPIPTPTLILILILIPISIPI